MKKTFVILLASVVSFSTQANDSELNFFGINLENVIKNSPSVKSSNNLFEIRDSKESNLFQNYDLFIDKSTNQVKSVIANGIITDPQKCAEIQSKLILNIESDFDKEGSNMTSYNKTIYFIENDIKKLTISCNLAQNKKIILKYEEKINKVES